MGDKMDFDDLNWYLDFEPELTKESELLCPECKKWSHMSKWEESEVGCDLCGGHVAIVCPLCDYYFDHVFCRTFQTRLVK